MKKMFFLYTAMLGLAVTAPSAADEGFYAGIIGGANWVSVNHHHHHRGDNNAGYLVGCDFGYTLCNNFSAEGEFVYRHNDTDHVRWNNKWGHDNHHAKGGNHHKKGHKGHGDLKGYSVMANVRYDVPIDCCFTPYVRGGIGWARTKFHASGHHWDQQNNCKGDHWGHHNSKNGFAWQVGAGLSFPVYCNTVLDVGYNFLRAQKEINNNSFVAALRYMF